MSTTNEEVEIVSLTSNLLKFQLNNDNQSIIILKNDEEVSRVKFNYISFTNRIVMDFDIYGITKIHYIYIIFKLFENIYGNIQNIAQYMFDIYFRIIIHNDDLDTFNELIDSFIIDEDAGISESKIYKIINQEFSYICRKKLNNSEIIDNWKDVDKHINLTLQFIPFISIIDFGTDETSIYIRLKEQVAKHRKILNHEVEFVAKKFFYKNRNVFDMFHEINDENGIVYQYQINNTVLIYNNIEKCLGMVKELFCKTRSLLY